MARRSAGEGSVFQRSDKTKRSSWVAEIAVRLPDGSRKVVTGYGTTQKEAKAERERKVREALAAAASRTRWTVGQYLDHFLAQCEARVRANTMSIRTYATYETDVRVNIKPRLGRVPLERLAPHQVQEWITGLLAEKSAATTRKARATLHTALEAAVDWGFLTKNPIPKRSGIQERAPEIVVWSEAEVTRFLDVAYHHRLYALFYLAIDVGMRQGELLGLRWPDIDLDRNEIRIRKTLKTVPAKHRALATGNRKLEHLTGPHFLGEPKTPRSSRDVLLSRDTIQVLAAHFEAQLEEKRYTGPDYRDFGLVFCTGLGTPISQRNLKRVYDRLIEKAAVPDATFHDQRDLSASLLIAKGVDIAVVSERLGHSRKSTTWDKYVRVVESARQRAVMSLREKLE